MRPADGPVLAPLLGHRARQGAFDLATKPIVFARVGPRGPASRSSRHPGAPHQPQYRGALGLRRGMPYSSLIFAALSIVAAVAILYWLFVRGAATDLKLTVALGLIMAGALGNCYDRLVFGHVRDFVHFHVDPIHFDCAIFNFADNMLVAGAVLLMLLALRPEPPEPPNTPPSRPRLSTLRPGQSTRSEG